MFEASMLKKILRFNTEKNFLVHNIRKKVKIQKNEDFIKKDLLGKVN